jgi:hypothetical protein
MCTVPAPAAGSGTRHAHSRGRVLTAAAIGAAALPAGALAVHHLRGGGCGGGGNNSSGNSAVTATQRRGVRRVRRRPQMPRWLAEAVAGSTAEALQTLAGYPLNTLKVVCQHHGTPLLASLAQLRQTYPGRHLIPVRTSALRLDLCACICSC